MPYTVQYLITEKGLLRVFECDRIRTNEIYHFPEFCFNDQVLQ